MIVATIAVEGESRAALISEDRELFAPLPFASAQDVIRVELVSPGSVAEQADAWRSLTGASLLAPIPRPGKVFGSGINYQSHFQENPSAVLPVEPGFFSKFPSSVVAPGASIVLPEPESQVDYEVELAVVIGAPGKDIQPERAFEHVFGYTMINDVSGRDVQFRANQMDLGKGFDSFCPMGPWIVTADEVPDPGGIRLRSIVNGEVRQDATTAEWIYSIPELIAHASRHLTLETGDVITTGTPAGCGTFRNPPLWLRPGDDVIVEADGIGSLRNPVVAGW